MYATTVFVIFFFFYFVFSLRFNENNNSQNPKTFTESISLCRLGMKFVNTGTIVVYILITNIFLKTRFGELRSESFFVHRDLSSRIDINKISWPSRIVLIRLKTVSVAPGLLFFFENVVCINLYLVLVVARGKYYSVQCLGIS